jgi:peptide/nickel transport system substrate-binding protein
VKRTIYALLTALVLASMTLAACGPTATEAPASTQAPATAAPAEKGINIAFEQEPDQLVAAFSNMSFAAWIWQMFGVGPGRWDDKNNLVPYAATEIPSTENGGVSADGLTITYHLKPNLKWSDGEPITSKDFVTTWKVTMDPGTAPISRAGFDKIDSIDTPDDQTVVIHFKELYPSWPTIFNIGPNNLGGGLMPAHIFDGKTAVEKDPQVHQPTWAGGPFMIKEWVAGDHMTLVRNPNFFGDKPKLDYINIKFVPDPETGLAALKAGDVDLMVNLAESDVETVKALAPQGIQLRVDPTPEFEHLFFNLGITDSAVKDGDGNVIGNSDVAGFCPFEDPNVRKAIMLGIDRLSFIKNYLKEDEKAFIASLWPNSYWYNTSITPYPYDPDQANSLLDAAGYPVGADGIRAGKCNGQDVVFSVGLETTTAQRRIDNMAAIQADLKKVGIDVKPNPIPAGTYFGSYPEGADLQTGKFDMGIYTTGFYPDPDPGDSFLCSGVPSKDHPTGQNNYHYCDQTGKLDQLFKDGLATADPAGRKKVYDQIQQVLYDDVLIVPLYARANVYAYQSTFVFPPTSGYSNFAWDSEYFDTTK